VIHDRDFTDEQLLLTTVQAARVLGVGRTKIYQLISDGQLRPVHVARCCRLSWAELERYVMHLDEANHTAPGADEPAPPRTERRWRRAETNDGRRGLFAVEVPAVDGDSAA
jgi:excisionase family DNA binding protein